MSKLRVMLGDPFGPEGNVFVVAGKVVQALRDADQSYSASEFRRLAIHECNSYEEVLKLVADFVEIVD